MASPKLEQALQHFENQVIPVARKLLGLDMLLRQAMSCRFVLHHMIIR